MFWVQVLEKTKALVRPEVGFGGGGADEASRGLVEALAGLGQELREREDLRQELLRYIHCRGQ